MSPGRLEAILLTGLFHPKAGLVNLEAELAARMIPRTPYDSETKVRDS